MSATGDDSRYALGYVRSVLDVAKAFGAEPYLDVDHMPRALSANPTPSRTEAMEKGACGTTWTNYVSNQKPADPAVFAAAVAGLVKRVVEGSDGEPGRPVRYWEVWNEPDLGYAWAPTQTGDFTSYIVTASAVLGALDAYRTQTADPAGRAIRIGFGSFANAAIAAKLLPAVDAPFDFISFHSEVHDDPLATVADIEAVAAARRASAKHKDAELVLAEWSQSLTGSTLDPATMDVALHNATVIALGAALGLSRAHHALFWDFLAPGVPALGLLAHDFTPKPAYYAYTLLARVIRGGSSRLAASGFEDGKLDGGMGAVLASLDDSGAVRVLLINRNDAARTASVGATPSTVTVFDDPSSPPHDATPTAVVKIPARSLVLIEL